MTSYSDVILWLSISYALLGVLLLAILTFAKLSWPIKASLIVVTSAFYVVNFLASRALLGWSSIDPLPPRFKLLQARIVEPHSLAGDAGAIHLWVEELDKDNFPSGEPRAYRLPYERQASGEDRGGDQSERRRKASGRPDRGFWDRSRR